MKSASPRSAATEIAKAGADILVYTSHEVRPVIREQSRLNSVLIEAYATSRGRKQLKGIEDIAKKYGFRYGVQTLLSFGGLTSINHPRLHETMISGPIGGILGAAYVGKLIGNDSLICSDMGGTSLRHGRHHPRPDAHRERAADGPLQAQRADAASRHDRRRCRHDPEGRPADPQGLARAGKRRLRSRPDLLRQGRNRTDHRRLRCHPWPPQPALFPRRQGRARRSTRRRAFEEKCARRAGRRRRGGRRRHDRHAGGRRQQRAAPRHFRPGHPSVGIHAALLWRLGAAASCRLLPGASASRTSSPSSSPRPSRPSAAPRPTSCAGIRCRRRSTSPPGPPRTSCLRFGAKGHQRLGRSDQGSGRRDDRRRPRRARRSRPCRS